MLIVILHTAPDIGGDGGGGGGGGGDGALQSDGPLAKAKGHAMCVEVGNNASPADLYEPRPPRLRIFLYGSWADACEHVERDDLLDLIIPAHCVVADIALARSNSGAALSRPPGSTELPYCVALATPEVFANAKLKGIEFPKDMYTEDGRMIVPSIVVHRHPTRTPPPAAASCDGAGAAKEGAGLQAAGWKRMAMINPSSWETVPQAVKAVSKESAKKRGGDRSSGIKDPLYKYAYAPRRPLPISVCPPAHLPTFPPIKMLFHTPGIQVPHARGAEGHGRARGYAQGGGRWNPGSGIQLLGCGDGVHATEADRANWRLDDHARARRREHARHRDGVGERVRAAQQDGAGFGPNQEAHSSDAARGRGRRRADPPRGDQDVGWPAPA